MKNYSARFQLPNGKWAYMQVDDLARRARLHMGTIRKLWTPPASFYHLRSGGHVAALHLHSNNKWYGKLDLSRFFNTVTRNRITKSLKRIGYSFRDAQDFAIVSTVYDHQSKQFVLPFGFVQSPLLASLALDLSALGQELQKIAKQNAITTVYVDDVIISSDSETVVQEAMTRVKDKAHESGFRVNERKCEGPSETLNAFNIGLSDGELEINPDRFEEMCQLVLHSGAGAVSSAILNYVRSVSAYQADHMFDTFTASFQNS